MTVVIPLINFSNAIVDSNGRPMSWYIQATNNQTTAIIKAVGDLANLVTEVTGQGTAITSAAGAASGAQSTANTAQTTASSAISQAQALAAQVALANSYPTPSNTLSATANASTATVSIAGHTRRYFDGSSVAINAGSIAGLARSTPYWVYYSDPSHTGGAVAFHASTIASDASQANGVHCVGKIVTPANASATTTGGGWGGPGVPL